jgi:hypothetical protein
MKKLLLAVFSLGVMTTVTAQTNAGDTGAAATCKVSIGAGSKSQSRSYSSKSAESCGKRARGLKAGVSKGIKVKATYKGKPVSIPSKSSRSSRSSSSKKDSNTVTRSGCSRC